MNDLDTLFEKAQALRGAMLKARTKESVAAQLFDFLQGVDFIGLPQTYEQVWFRARKCEDRERFDSLHELIYPAEGPRDFGRAQYPRSRVLYASWNLRTALEETGIVSAGDRVQVITTRLRSGVEMPCHVIGELQHLHYAGRSQLRPESEAQQLWNILSNEGDLFRSRIFIDAVMSEFFRAIVKRAYDYKITAAFSEGVLSAKGGLMYPSVEGMGAMNLAVSAKVFDELFEVLDTTVFQILKYLGYGLYQAEPLCMSSNFRANGDIEWQEGKSVESSVGPYGNLRVDPDRIGWRKA